MSTEWINLDALWRIIVIGAICGAGLPALFAVGLKSLSLGGEIAGTTDSSGAEVATARHPMGLVVAGLCFAVVLAAIGWGIYLIVAGT